jgi:hypothetical protein
MSNLAEHASNRVERSMALARQPFISKLDPAP